MAHVNLTSEVQFWSLRAPSTVVVLPKNRPCSRKCFHYYLQFLWAAVRLGSRCTGPGSPPL